MSNIVSCLVCLLVACSTVGCGLIGGGIAVAWYGLLLAASVVVIVVIATGKIITAWRRVVAPYVNFQRNWEHFRQNTRRDWRLGAAEASVMTAGVMLMWSLLLEVTAFGTLGRLADAMHVVFIVAYVAIVITVMSSRRPVSDSGKARWLLHGLQGHVGIALVIIVVDAGRYFFSAV